MIFACSYSLFPWIVTPSGPRETVPEMNNISPTRRAFDQRPGGGSATRGLVILLMSIPTPVLFKKPSAPSLASPGRLILSPTGRRASATLLSAAAQVVPPDSEIYCRP